jgi:antitoxin MazE
MVMQVRRNFQVTLPSSVRKSLGIGVGDILDATVKDGRIVISPKKAVDAEQAWFWTKDWQEAEKEAETDLRSGKVKKYNSIKELIKGLDK